MPKLNRREFLRLAAAGMGALASGSVAAACSQSAETPTLAPAPTQIPLTALPEATATEAPVTAPAATPTVADTTRAFRRPEIIQYFPQVKSQVVLTRHSGAWSDKTLVPGAVRQMVDATITKLTGLNDVKEAWQALFSPDEKIAIKVNAFGNSIIFTHQPLVLAVTDSLVEAGIPAENIIIYDSTSRELTTAHFVINKDGPGVRCTGTDGKLSGSFKIAGYSQKLSDVLLSSDALINMPVLKSHMIAGVTFALKNHFGSAYLPSALHRVGTAIPELSILPEIKDRTRLVVGDILGANLKYGYSWPYWTEDYQGDSILMTYDPLAADAAGFKILSDLITAKGDSSDSLYAMAKDWMANSEKAGVGAASPENYEVVE